MINIFQQLSNVEAGGNTIFLDAETIIPAHKVLGPLQISQTPWGGGGGGREERLVGGRRGGGYSPILP